MTFDVSTGIFDNTGLPQANWHDKLDRVLTYGSSHPKIWRAAIDAVRTLPEQRAAVIEFPKHRKIFIDGFVFVPAVVA